MTIDDECLRSTGLIVGGVDAMQGEFPHQAAIGYPDGLGSITFQCGGSLISDRFVLTAAHCRKPARHEPTIVRLGAWNIKVQEFSAKDVPILRFITHENYNPATKENDIAVIQMRDSVDFSTSLRPACLAQPGTLLGQRATATGW